MAEAERAIALDPNDAESYVALANVFNIFGERTTEAIELIEKAMRLNPRYPFEYPIPISVGPTAWWGATRRRSLPRNKPCCATPIGCFLTLSWSLNYRLQWSSQLSQDPQTLDRAFEAAQRMVALDASSPCGVIVY